MKIRRIISTLVGFALLCGLLWALTHREHIAKRIADYAIAHIEMRTGWKVHLEKIRVSLPFQLRAERITLSSQDEPLLELKDCSISMTLWDIIHDNHIFSRIHIGDLTLHAIPSQSPSDPSIEPNDRFHYLRVQDLEIERLHLSEKVLNAFHLQQHSVAVTDLFPLHIKASGTIDPVINTAHINVAISQNDSEQNPTQMALVISPQKEQWQAQLHITEPQHGFLTTFGHFPDDYTYQAFLQLTGSPQNWMHPLSAQEGALLGDFQLSYSTNPKDLTDSPLSTFLSNYGCIKGLCSLNGVSGLQISKLTGIIGPVLMQGACSCSPEGLLDGTSLTISSRDASTSLTPYPLNWQGLKIDCHCNGSISSPQVSIALDSKMLETNGYHFEDIALDLDMSQAQQVLHGQVQARSTYQQYDIGISTTFAWEDGVEMNLSNLRARIGEAKVYGDIRVTMPEMDISGKLNGHLDLPTLSDFLKADAQGTLRFTASARKEHSAHVIDVNLESPHVKIAELEAEHLQLNATIRSLLNQPNASLNLSCNKAAWENLQCIDLNAETFLDPQSAHWPFTLSSTNLLHESLHLHTKGFWHLAQDGLRLNIDEATGSLSTYPLTLQEPVSLLITPSTHTLSPLSATVGPATITATVTEHEDDLDAAIKFHNLPLELVRQFYPELAANGTINAELSLTENKGVVTGVTQVTIDDIMLLGDDAALFPPMQASLEADLKDTLLHCSGHLIGLGPHPVHLTAKLPVELTLHPPTLFIDREKELQAQLALDGKVESLLELFLPITSTPLTGDAEVAVNVAGTIAQPLITGHIDLRKGSFELLDIGAEVRNVTAHADLEGTRLLLTSVQATGLESGHVTGTGSAELNFQEALPFDLTFQLDNINIAPFDYAEANASGELNFKGNGRFGKVTGTLTSESMQITVPEQLPALSQAVQVTYINQPTDRPPPTSYTPNHSLWPISYNLQIDIPGNGIISGHDWSSRWKGNFVMKGLDSEMLLNGSCQLIQGEYRFNGEPFKIREGTITFAGDPKKKTTLYVVANKDLDSLLVDIILKGPIKNPAITFRSNPPMSQREILSWILFNRGSSEISSFQGTQLNESITNLNTGGSSKPDMLTRIRKRMGIDRLDISRKNHGDENEVSVQVGKYISRGILVSVNKGITDETNRLGIEANIIKDVKVHAEVGDDKEAQLHLKWKKDY